MELILILFSILLIPYVIRFIKTKGTMYDEKIIYRNGQPDHIICTNYNFFGIENVKIKKHPEALIKSIIYHVNDPSIKHIGDQIKKYGSWCEKDGIPKNIIEESKKYRENYKTK